MISIRPKDLHILYVMDHRLLPIYFFAIFIATGARIGASVP